MGTWFQTKMMIFRDFQKMSQKCGQFSYGTFGGRFLGLLVPLRRDFLGFYLIYGDQMHYSDLRVSMGVVQNFWHHFQPVFYICFTTDETSLKTISPKKVISEYK